MEPTTGKDRFSIIVRALNTPKAKMSTRRPSTSKYIVVLFLACLSLVAGGARAGELACGSIEGEVTHCSLPGADKANVKLKQRLDGACKFRQSWGVDHEGVWVDLGCRAVFKYSSPAVAQTGWRRFLPKWTR